MPCNLSHLFEDFNEAMTYYFISIISDFYITYKEYFQFSSNERITNLSDSFEIFEEIQKIFAFLDVSSNIEKQIKLLFSLKYSLRIEMKINVELASNISIDK